MLCSFPKCPRVPGKSGLCNPHQMQRYSGIALTPIDSHRERNERRRREDVVMLPSVVEQARRRVTLAEQARALGVTMTRLQLLRTAARKAGFDVHDADDSPRLNAFDKGGPRCGRCELLLPHVCAGTAAQYARSGRPSGGDMMGWRHGE
jgi:hypothetical protein